MEFTEKEDDTFHQTVEWLSEKLCTSPTVIQQNTNELSVNPFNRIVIDRNVHQIHLTAK